MLPAVRSGQFVITRRSKPHNPVNRLVVFENQGILKIKRITRVSQMGYWVLGDNRHFSQDSRHFGDLNIEKVRGYVIKIF